MRIFRMDEAFEGIEGTDGELSSALVEGAEADIQAESGCCHSCGPKAERSDELRTSLLRRLSRIEGQIRGIGRMVAQDVYCDDVLSQISAARSALDGAALLVLEHHLHHCVAARMRAGDETIVDELKATLGRLLRS